MQVSLEEALQHETSEMRHDGPGDAGQQLGAGRAWHAQLHLKLGQVVQFAAALETERPLGQFQRAGQPHGEAAETAFRLIENQQPLVQVDRAVDVHPEGQVVDWLARQLLVQQAQPAHVQLARE